MWAIGFGAVSGEKGAICTASGAGGWRRSDRPGGAGAAAARGGAAPGVSGVGIFGCFGSPEFLERLKGLAGRDQLVVAGIESHICVAQTVLGALERGYTVHVASDAVGSRSEENRAVGIGRMERAGALVSSTDMAIYELLGRSDGIAFKKMLPLLK